jgi:hypothetical protein
MDQEKEIAMHTILLIIKPVIASLLSLAIISGILALKDKNRIPSHWKKPEISFSILITSLFLLPIPFLIWSGDYSSPYIVGNYIKEIIVSVVLVLSVALILKATNYLIPKFTLSLRLKKLSLIEDISPSELWVAWEHGEITKEQVEANKTLHSLKRWIVQKNDMGWYELIAQIKDKKLTDPQAFWIVSRELTKIRQEKMKGSMPERNQDYENKLASLLPTAQVGVVWQMWDADLAIEGETLEINAFKKWAWENDETGWMHLNCILQNRKTISPIIIEFAKLELWEFEKKKKKRGAFDSLREKRLKSLILDRG